MTRSAFLWEEHVVTIITTCYVRVGVVLGLDAAVVFLYIFAMPARINHCCQMVDLPVIFAEL